METISAKKVNATELEQKSKKNVSGCRNESRRWLSFWNGSRPRRKIRLWKNGFDGIPTAAIESFAGVGYYFDMANLKETYSLEQIKGQFVVIIQSLW